MVSGTKCFHAVFSFIFYFIASTFFFKSLTLIEEGRKGGVYSEMRNVYWNKKFISKYVLYLCISLNISQLILKGSVWYDSKFDRYRELIFLFYNRKWNYSSKFKYFFFPTYFIHPKNCLALEYKKYVIVHLGGEYPKCTVCYLRILRDMAKENFILLRERVVYYQNIPL